MPVRESAPVGAPCWIDLMTSDTQRAREFYGELFGWDAEEPNEEFGGYFNFRKEGVRVAGCMQGQPGAGRPDIWSVYLVTDDATKTLEATVTGGGRVLVDAMPVADLGTMAVVEDPTGATIGVWQPGLHRGFGVLGEANTPGWFELHTRDYPAAVAFYRDAFGWDTHAAGNTPEFRYTVQVGPDGGWLAGIMDAAGFGPDEAAGQWSVYFAVDDTDSVLARVVELGGQVLRPAEDTPYGRLATATDPTGALFRLVAPNAAVPARDPAT